MFLTVLKEVNFWKNPKFQFPETGVCVPGEKREEIGPIRDLSYGWPEALPGPQIATGARMDVVRAVRRTCTSAPAGTATAASPSGRSVVGAASSNRADLRHGRRSALNQCLVPLIAVYHHEIGCLWPARPESTALTVTQIGPIRRRRDHAERPRRGRGGRAGRFRSARSAHGS